MSRYVARKSEMKQELYDTINVLQEKKYITQEERAFILAEANHLRLMWHLLNMLEEDENSPTDRPIQYLSVVLADKIRKKKFFEECPEELPIEAKNGNFYKYIDMPLKQIRGR